MDSVAFEIVNANYDNFTSLGKDFDFTSITNDSIRGRFAEHIFRMSAYIHLPSIVSCLGADYKVGDIKSIKFKSGTKSTGESDADLIFENDNKVLVVSVKWGENYHTEKEFQIAELKDYASKRYAKYRHVYGFAGKYASFTSDDKVSFGAEFFQKAWQEIWDYCASYDFDWNKIDECLRDRVALTLYPHQKEAIQKAKECFQFKKDFLFWHVCRTGKTVSALAYAKEAGWKRILVLSPLPSISYQFSDTLLTYDKFSDYTYFDHNDVQSTASFEDANVVLSSYQLLFDKEKYKNYFLENWDGIIIDEVHTFAENSNSGSIITDLKSENRLWLSATPYKNVMHGRFTEDNTHKFTNPELYALKNNGVSEYQKYPQINYLLYTSDTLRQFIKDASEFYDEDEWFKFEKLFQTTNNKFEYHNQVVSLIEKAFVLPNKMSILSNPLFQHTQNILIFVPQTSQQVLLSDLMKEVFERHGKSDTFGVFYTNSKFKESKDLKKFIQKVDNSTKAINIIIAVDQLSVGVTLKNCDMVMLWYDSGKQGLPLYVQRTERCKNPKIEENVYVLDFNPHRCLQYHGEIIESTSDNSLSISAIENYLAHIPIFEIGGNNLLSPLSPEQLHKDFVGNRYKMHDFTTLTVDDEIPVSLSDLLRGVIVTENDDTISEDLGELSRDDIPSLERISQGNSGTATTKPIIPLDREKIKTIDEVMLPWLHSMDRPDAHEDLAEFLKDLM